MRPHEQLEPLAEAVVFAHESDAGTASAFSPDDSDVLELERAAALATAALARPEPVPERLQAKLTASGLAFCAERQPAAARRAFQALAGGEGAPPPVRRNGLANFLLGVAAVGLIWLGVSLSRSEPVPPTIAEQRAALLEDPTARELAWTAGPSPLSGEVRGTVVWSDERQEGYLEFTGLPPLDDEHRFQLWIVDRKRVEADPDTAPVDGGLFAVDSAQGDTVVPIRAKLPVGSAAAFVVTVEKKEGVVVSAKEHIVAIAQ